MSSSEKQEEESDKKVESAESGQDSVKEGKEENKDASEADEEDGASAADYLAAQFNKFMKVSDEPKPESVLDEVSFEGIARYIKSDKCQKIVTMAGAGISTSAGIPDFRSPGSGLYDNLGKYNLPNPQAIFEINFFKENPEPFFTLCKELNPRKFKPTPCHYFIKLLDDKKKLLTHFTQNIDTLERVAGLSEDKVVEAHGSFATAHCLECRQKYTQEWLREKVFSSSEETVVPRCEEPDCDGVVKPDIVFFGENLPSKFILHINDLKECDLLIIMGTSLVVQPFASLTNRVKETTPRLYINLEKLATTNMSPLMAMLMGGQTFTFDSEDNIRDVFWQGTCDDGCYALADLLGWGDELREMVKTEHALLDSKETESKEDSKKTSGL